MKSSKKTWGMLGTSMGSMLIIVALLTMVGIGSQDTYAVKKLCICNHGAYNSGTSTCTWQDLEEYTCTKDTPGSYDCAVFGSTCKCKRWVDKSEPAQCMEYDPSLIDPDPSSSSKPSSSSSSKPSSSSSSKPTYECVVGSGCTTSSGQPGKCISTGSNVGGTNCVPINPNKPTGGDDDDKPNNPNKPTGGDDKPNNPNKPSGGGDDGLGGNGGGNIGGNGNGGNTGGNNGNNNGGNNATKNPNTATKAPLVIAIIGIMSVGISTVVYFKGKKEINTEI